MARASELEIISGHFADENSGQLKSSFHGGGTIIVPPSVIIGEDADGVPSVIYPVGDVMPLSDTGFPLLLHALEEEQEWEYQADIDNLLDDVLVLSRGDEISFPRRVQRFVRKYGPLWWCSTHRKSHLSLTSYDRRYAQDKPIPDGCSWSGVEPLGAFREMITEVTGVFKAVAAYKDGKPITREHIEAFGVIPAETLDMFLSSDGGSFFSLLNTNSEYVGSFLTGLVELKVQSFGDIVIKAVWHPGYGARMVVDTGLGVVPAMWQQVRQALAGWRGGMYVCTKCQGLYMADKRKPSMNQKNRCPDCRRYEARKADKRKNSKTIKDGIHLLQGRA